MIGRCVQCVVGLKSGKFRDLSDYFDDPPERWAVFFARSLAVDRPNARILLQNFSGSSNKHSVKVPPTIGSLVPEWAIGSDKDDPEVQAAVQKYVSVVNPNPTMVGMCIYGIDNRLVGH